MPTYKYKFKHTVIFYAIVIVALLLVNHRTNKADCHSKNGVLATIEGTKLCIDPASYKVVGGV